VSVVNGIVATSTCISSYVTAGHPVMALIDHDSLYAEGYFEENQTAWHPYGRSGVYIADG